MSHLTSPLSFRAGKLYLWKNNNLININNSQKSLNFNVNQSLGLEYALDWLLKRNHIFIVKSSSKLNYITGAIDLKILYYPLAAPLLYKKIFPTYCFPQKLVNKSVYFEKNFINFIKNLWEKKREVYERRFLSTKLKVHLNKWLRNAMFRGSTLHRHYKKITSALLKYSYCNKNILLKKKKLHSKLQIHITNYNSRKNFWKRWRYSANNLNDKYLSILLSKRVGNRINIKSINVFNYLIKKNAQLTYKNYQDHIWGSAYHFYKKRFLSYYDIVNSLYLICYLPYVEHLVIHIIQYSLLKIHKRRIKPKVLFYFLDAVLKNMTHIQDTFFTFRLIITGKLQGGTARTKSFSVGFGAIPYQTINANVRNLYGDVRSKYGSFGVKLVTWRKPVWLLEKTQKSRTYFSKNK